MRANCLSALVVLWIGWLGAGATSAQPSLYYADDDRQPAAISSRRSASPSYHTTPQLVGGPAKEHATSTFPAAIPTGNDTHLDIEFVPIELQQQFQPLEHLARNQGAEIGANALRFHTRLAAAEPPERDWSQVEQASQMRPAKDLIVDEYEPAHYDRGRQAPSPIDLSANLALDPSQCYDEWAGYCFFRSADGSTKCSGGTICEHHCEHGVLGSKDCETCGHSHGIFRHRDSRRHHRRCDQACRQHPCACSNCGSTTFATGHDDEVYCDGGCNICETGSDDCNELAATIEPECRGKNLRTCNCRRCRHRGCAN